MKMKPLGSEKLTGQEKIQRILEIANYKTNDHSINESTTEYTKYAVDGNTYAIVKENDGYYVKIGLNESSLDYVDGILNKNKNRFSSYSGALKKINLMIKPLNEEFNNGEEDPVLNETKYVLKKPAAAPSEEPVMDEPVMDEPVMDEPAMDAEDEELDLSGLNLGDDSEEDIESDLDIDDEIEEPKDEEESGSLKKVQKLTGKLGQALREIKIDLESSDIKYVLNSIISAVDLTKLNSEDLEDVMSNFEELDEFEIDSEESSDEESGLDDLDLDMDMEEPLADEELSESEFALNQYNNGWFDPSDNRLSDGFEDYDEELEFGPDDYDKFMDTVKNIPNARWNPMEKDYYDRFQRNPESGMSPLKLRVKNKKGTGQLSMFDIAEEEKEINEWGSSDQTAFNRSVHKDLGEPEKMPSPFSSDFESAVESAVDFYWDDWEEYKEDRNGLIEHGKRCYLRAYFKETFDMLVKMFEPAVEEESMDMEPNPEMDLDEGAFMDGLKTLGSKFLTYYKENPEARKMVNDLGAKAVSKGTDKIADRLDKSDTIDTDGKFSEKLKNVNPTDSEIDKLGNLIFGDLSESEVSTKIDNVLGKYFK